MSKDAENLARWFVLSNEEGHILAVYGSALRSEADAKQTEIAKQTACRVFFHDILGPRPRVGQTISMVGMR